MKAFILSLCSSALLFSSCSSQGIASSKVPSVVHNTLKAKYPIANNVDWEKYGNVYEAELDINDSVEISVRIDDSGNLLMQKQDVPNNDLSTGIKTVIQDHYKDHRLNEVEKIEKNGAVYYQVELKGKGKKEVNLVFSADGREEKSISYWD